MRVGIPTEIKVQEFRVGITPAGVHALKEAGHTVLVQKGAGLGSMITDEEYVAAGAQMVATAKECWDCDMVVKVKEPLAPEYDLFHEGLILYTYLHLAPEPALTKALLDDLLAYRKVLEPYVGDGVAFVHRALAENKRILLEGQLGSMKDPALGICPFTTSSHTLAGYGAVGGGVPPTALTDVVCVSKA